MNENTRDRREQVQVVLQEREVAGEGHLHDEQHDRRHPGDEQQERHQNRQLAEDVLGARQRLRQIDLQRVGAAIVGDQAGADVDRDEEDEDLLLVEELPERLRRRREKRGLRQVRGGVDLDGADEERKPRRAAAGRERPASRTSCGCRRARSPSSPGRAARSSRRSGDSPDRESASAVVLFFSDRVREHVLERRHARPQMAHLDALRRRRARTAAARRRRRARTRA